MGVPWSLYAAHTLSTWGDNMWWFAGSGNNISDFFAFLKYFQGGCYMLELLPTSLRLTATYGLVISASGETINSNHCNMSLAHFSDCVWGKYWSTG